jgi:hypothetical protein
LHHIVHPDPCHPIANFTHVLPTATGDLTVPPRQEITEFDPAKTHAKLAGLDGNIVTLRRLRDWPSLKAAVDAKIAEQAAFVAWWDTGPGQRQHENQHTLLVNAAAGGPLPVAEAETQTGISQQTVSRWRTALADRDAYTQRILLGAHRAAFLAPADDPAMLRPQPGRDGPDFWATPDDLIAAFIKHVLPLLPPDRAIWECAAGSNRLAAAIAHAGRRVFVSDKYPTDDLPLRDFLTTRPPAPDTIAATNPPFNILNEFLARGSELLDEGLARAPDQVPAFRRGLAADRAAAATE